MVRNSDCIHTVASIVTTIVKNKLNRKEYSLIQKGSGKAGTTRSIKLVINKESVVRR